VLPKERAKLLDGAVQIAHAVEGAGQALPRLGEVGLRAERLTQPDRRRREISQAERGPAEVEIAGVRASGRISGDALSGARPGSVWIAQPT